ncbi:MAG: urea amidolyase family protein [Corynebacterium sp.]|nr:urea amidolyase family protein [Corynebacterium sp.]
MKIHAVGTRALLIDLDDLSAVMDWHAAIKDAHVPGLVDAIAAATTLLLKFAAPSQAKAAREFLKDFTVEKRVAGDSRTVEIDVVYDGEDLAAAAEAVDLSPEALIDWHTSTEWTAAFGGFAPGFTYCVPSDASEGKDFPRRPSPRTAVPMGAVALAGNFSAVYPRTSPGGWQLIGRTASAMWDSQAKPPALLQPGDKVRYRRVTDFATPPQSADAHSLMLTRLPKAELIDAGQLTLYEDLGRPGLGDLGVSLSGAADRAAARTANRAVGNAAHATELENIGGLHLKALSDIVVSVTGALATVTITSAHGKTIPASLATPLLVPAGAELKVAAATRGLRTYVAIRGGFAAYTELDSASTDILSGLGPAPLQAGDTLFAVPEKFSTPGVTVPTLSNPLRVVGPHSTAEDADKDTNSGETHGEVRCVLGPRADWFSKEAIAEFLSTQWVVTADSNRVGLRLQHPNDTVLDRVREGELASEGMVPGSIQIPPSGSPVVFLRDHAVTGGYPVIATVIDEDVDIAAQLPPGATVKFTEFSTSQ